MCEGPEAGTAPEVVTIVVRDRTPVSLRKFIVKRQQERQILLPGRSPRSRSESFRRTGGSRGSCDSGRGSRTRQPVPPTTAHGSPLVAWRRGNGAAGGTS